ncbi:MAG TPA: hypothetical protein VJR27_00685 [Candidatus Saccharimonadales bacterium]|nr:hypothetical protein [Candidatus Saccharimonadales bacterium]
MKIPEKPAPLEIRPVEQVIVGVGRLLTRAYFEEALMPAKPGSFTRQEPRWISRYRLDVPPQKLPKSEKDSVIWLQRDANLKSYYWDGRAHRIAFQDDAHLFVPRNFADEHFSTLTTFAKTQRAGCSMHDQDLHRHITLTRMSLDRAATAVVGLLTLDQRL